jgi:N-acetylneuraminic acid mutarotase
MYMAGWKQLESWRDSFRQLKILTIYSLYIQETILRAKEKCTCAVNKQVYIYNTRNNDYHKYVHNLVIFNSKPAAADCIFHNKLPSNIKQIVNNNQFKKVLKDLHIKGWY